MDGIANKERGVRFGRKHELMPKRVDEIRALREGGTTVPDIIWQTRSQQGEYLSSAKLTYGPEGGVGAGFSGADCEGPGGPAGPAGPGGPASPLSPWSPLAPGSPFSPFGP